VPGVAEAAPRHLLRRDGDAGLLAEGEDELVFGNLRRVRMSDRVQHAREHGACEADDLLGIEGEGRVGAHQAALTDWAKGQARVRL